MCHPEDTAKRSYFFQEKKQKTLFEVFYKKMGKQPVMKTMKKMW